MRRCSLPAPPATDPTRRCTASASRARVATRRSPPPDCTRCRRIASAPGATRRTPGAARAPIALAAIATRPRTMLVSPARSVIGGKDPQLRRALAVAGEAGGTLDRARLVAGSPMADVTVPGSAMRGRGVRELRPLLEDRLRMAGEAHEVLAARQARCRSLRLALRGLCRR